MEGLYKNAIPHSFMRRMIMLTNRIERDVEALAQRWYYVIWVNKTDNETEGKRVTEFNKDIQYIPTVMQLNNFVIENLKELGKIRRVSKQDKEAIKKIVTRVWKETTELEKKNIKQGKRN